MDRQQITAMLSGQTLADYQVLAYRGSGAFAHVFDAEHVHTGAQVALKILDPGAGAVQHREFDNEGDLLKALCRCSAVVDIEDSLQASVAIATVSPSGTNLQIQIPVRFHVLERADRCLDELLLYRQSLDWGAKLALYRQAVLGIHQMHLAHIAHRDSKAANCLVFQRPMNHVNVKISDLGRSRDLRHTGTARIPDYQWGRGDPDFAPPEMFWLLGADTPGCHIRADLYGIGSVLYEVATGQGITAAALGSGVPYIQRAATWTPAQRSANYLTELPNLRAALEVALGLLDTEVPTYLRPYFLQLLRHLCEPDPIRREEVVRDGKRLIMTPDLQWLLRKVDIMARVYVLHEQQDARRALKRAQRARSAQRGA
jgi:eukaryotic-like serine/threonine-protein kinase